MNMELQEEMRRKYSDAMVRITKEFKARGYSAEEVVPSTIATLVSLAAFIARENMDMDPVTFIDICVKGTQIEYYGEEDEEVEFKEYRPQ